MNILASIDIAASMAALGAIVVLGVKIWRVHALRHCDVLVLALLSALVLFYCALALDGIWPNPHFQRANGFLGILLPVFWGYAFYGIQQEKRNADLTHRESLHRQFIENQPMGLCRTNIQAEGGRFVVANPALARMLGCGSVEALMESKVSDFYRNPEDRKRLLDKLMDDGRIDGLELEGKKRDGTEIFVSLTMRLIRDGDGNPIEGEGTIEDITSRKQAELALQRRERLHRQAQRIAGLGHWEVCFRGDDPAWSEQMYRIFEIDRGRFDGLFDKFLERVHPDDREQVDAAVAAAEENGVEINHVHRLLFPDGRVKFIRAMGRAEYDDNGELIRLIGTCQDVTRLKEAEAEREKTERRLLQAQKLEAIGTLAGGIAHDFNNILTSIIGFSQLALRNLSPDGPATGKLDVVLQAGMRARDLVDNILAFSRESEQEFKPVQPRIIVKEVIKLLRASIPANIEIKQDISTQCGRVLADPVQIHQVVMNLCTNAYHAIGAGGGRITVELAQIDLGASDLQAGFEARPGPHVHLKIGDTGTGMDRQVLSRIFDPYFTTKKRGEGTGLGLSVVHGIVKKHNGQISVYSEPGKGTVFHVFLPCVDGDGDAAAGVRAESIAGGTEHILVVDDEKPITLLLTELLTGLGYRVSAFTSSEAALAFVTARSDGPDMIITDMNMPVMCGDELAERVLAVRPDVPIIICTGFSENLDEARAKAIGIREYLIKPVTERRLAACIRCLLDECKSV